MRNSSLLVLKIIWIVTGILSTGIAVRIALTSGGNKIWFFSLMALISFLFAWIRHKQRKKS
jgi:hypothetical protein